ncbi:MAG TPA: anti-sigma factor [Candidatus Acidoferrales bacterium]|nr:anti-sigma factor [Candidatus Acidoferrales bacterium]
MTCSSVLRKLPGYLDGALSAREHAAIARHLPGCDSCRGQLQGYARMAALLARVETPAPPAGLSLRIRLAVDHVRSETVWRRVRRAASRMIVDILEPLAVPATGGVAASLFVYALMLHSFFVGVPLGAVPHDQPIPVVQPARLESLSALPASAGGQHIPDLNADVTLVEFTVDAEGQAVSYEVLSGRPDRETRRQLDHMLMFSHFQPQLSFGRPTAGGRVLVRFDEFHVRG